MSGKAPSEAALTRVERTLRKLPPGSQRAVGGGIYLRLDGDGRRRFQFRTRTGTKQPGGTYDSWEEAADVRADCELLAESRADGLETVVSLRQMVFEDYARKHWWRDHVLVDLDVTTQVDYKRYLDDAIALIGRYSLQQIATSPTIVGEIRRKVKELKTFPETHEHRPGEFASAAADHVLQVIRAVLSYAVKNKIINRNPFIGEERFHASRGPNGRKSGGHREIHESEVKHPRVIAQAALGFRGSIAQVEANRAIGELIAYGGCRPQDLAGMHHRCWRDKNGPLDYLKLEEAVKDIGGHKFFGEPKTGKRKPILWPAMAEQLERVWQAQGAPGLDALVVTDTRGGLLDWGNWRVRWYVALQRAGISEGRWPRSIGAFEPYLCRHIGIDAMLHAVRPEDLGGGVYSRDEVARQYGHTVETLNKVYAGIPDDLHGIAGLTMDEIIRNARREVWGPIPGDRDYEEILYTTPEIAQLTGLTVNAVGARIQRGYLPAIRDGRHYLVSDHDLVLVGLLKPRHMRGSAAA